MNETSRDAQMRMAAFDHVRRLMQVHDVLTAAEIQPGFIFEGERIPVIDPGRGIFKPRRMQYLLSIKTVFLTLVPVPAMPPGNASVQVSPPQSRPPAIVR
jgi:hypothetical protein